MYATPKGTARHIDRFPKYRDAAFYRTILGLNAASLNAASLNVVSLRIGTYQSADDDATGQAYVDAPIAAGEGGINLIDTTINYRNQRAIQLTRSTPGVAAALVGMGRREHVLENLGVTPAAPVTHEQYRRLYQ